MLIKEMADTSDMYKRTVLQMMYSLCKEVEVNLHIIKNIYKSIKSQSVVIGGVVFMIATKLNLSNSVEIQRNGINV